MAGGNLRCGYRTNLPALHWHQVRLSTSAILNSSGSDASAGIALLRQRRRGSILHSMTSSARLLQAELASDVAYAGTTLTRPTAWKS